MAQRLAQTGLRMSNSAPVKTNYGYSPNSRLLNVRFRSGGSWRKDGGNGEGAQLIEVDLGDSESEVEVFGIKRLEDAIQGIIVRRAAPDWLPFLPGASYWVPPRKNSGGLVDLLGKLSNPMTKEESLSFTTARGWPSSSYYIEGASPHPVDDVSPHKNKDEEEE